MVKNPYLYDSFIDFDDCCTHHPSEGHKHVSDIKISSYTDASMSQNYEKKSKIVFLDSRNPLKNKECAFLGINIPYHRRAQFRKAKL